MNDYFRVSSTEKSLRDTDLMNSWPLGFNAYHGQQMLCWNRGRQVLILFQQASWLPHCCLKKESRSNVCTYDLCCTLFVFKTLVLSCLYQSDVCTLRPEDSCHHDRSIMTLLRGSMSNTFRWSRKGLGVWV